MLTFLGIVHLLACIGLIILAMIQDSKGGGMFSSQTTSNSVLGATGGASLAVTMTKVLSVVVLLTCIAIAVVYKSSNKSVIDGSLMNVNGAVPAPAPSSTPLQPAQTPTEAPSSSPEPVNK